MRNLIPPVIDAKAFWNDIVSLKHEPRKSRLLAITPQIHSLFDQYNTSKNNLELLISPIWSVQAKSDLLNCYSSSTLALEEIKFNISKAQPAAVREWCHFCGLGNVSDFEHYLPKSNFPEYSVFALNLMPCCNECNRRKHNIFLRSGNRQILHLYFDQVPNERFLKVDITTHQGEPSAAFSLWHNPKIPSDIFSLLSTHWRRLGLLKRYNRFSSGTFDRIVETADAYQISTVLELQELLQTEYIRWKRIYSDNYWEAVIFDTLSQDATLLKNAFSSTLPYLI